MAESSAELWGKSKDTLVDAGEVIADKTKAFTDKAIGMAKDIVENAHEKMSATNCDTDDVMDKIIAETESPAAERETWVLPDIPTPRDRDEMTTPAMLRSEINTPPPATPIVKMTEKRDEKTGQERDTFIDISEKVLNKAAGFTEELGGKVLEKGEKMGETAIELGGAILEESGEAMGKARDFAEDFGSKIIKAKGALMQKANEEATKSGKLSNSLIDKMKKLNQKLEDKISGDNEEFADKPLNMGDSELNKHENFWDKAKLFAEGDHHMKGKQPKPGEMTIGENPDYKAPGKGKVKGFEDGDGDGDELIDDAIIDDGK